MAAWDDVCVRAMVLHAAGEPLRLEEVPVPEPKPGQVLLRVSACGVCRTDLHVVDGELPHPKLPLVLGHQVVGRTEDGRRLGVPWLGWTDGTCRYCLSGRENLCDRLASPATTSTAATRSGSSPTSVTAYRCPTNTTTCRRRPSSAPG